MGVSIFVKLSYSICHIYYSTYKLKKNIPLKETISYIFTLKSLEKMYLNHFLKTAQ